jgi:hypothetical protein
VSRRRRRFRWTALAIALAAGVTLGAGAWSLTHRNRTAAPPPPGDPDLRIEVLNGCGISGVGDQAASLLRRGGYRVEQIGNADHFHYHEDIVIARTVPWAKAEEVVRWLPGAIVVEQRVPGYPYDLTVIVGQPRSLVPAR